MSFLPLDLTDPDSIETVLSHIDYTMQYGEDEEPKEVRQIPLTEQIPGLLRRTLSTLFCSHKTLMKGTLRTWSNLGSDLLVCHTSMLFGSLLRIEGSLIPLPGDRILVFHPLCILRGPRQRFSLRKWLPTPTTLEYTLST